MTRNLSVVITAHNNQDLIKDCLKSVKFADQIIVVDNESTDDTAKIAKKLGAKVVSHQNNPQKLNQSKNFGFKLATGNWILSLDTDERVDPALKKEIKTIVTTDPKDTSVDGFLIPRKNIIFGKWIKHGLWYPDYQLRLFKHGRGQFPNIHNHEMLVVKGDTKKLKNHLTHYNYNTISQFVQKIDKQYSDNEANTFLDRGNKIHWYDALRFPLQDFLTNYFAREAYKDGLHGLVLSILQSFYMFIVFCKIWERQGFKEQKVSLSDTQSEINRFNRQLRHWFIHAHSQSGGVLTKIWQKIKSVA